MAFSGAGKMPALPVALSTYYAMLNRARKWAWPERIAGRSEPFRGEIRMPHTRKIGSLTLLAVAWLKRTVLQRRAAMIGALAGVGLLLSLRLPVSGLRAEKERAAEITVHLSETLGTIDPRIFGHYTEETLSSYEGGISSQMLVNRKFGMPEERDINNFLFTGTGAGWEPLAIRSHVTLVLDQAVYFSAPQSQRITHTGGDEPAGIQQKGYRYVMPHITPQQRVAAPFRFRPGERYHARLAIKNQDLKGAVHVALGESYQKEVASHTFQFRGKEDWKVYECILRPSAETRDGKFLVYINAPGTVWIDSVSLVREDLDDEGFRRDALELTRRVKPTSLRWPGGWFVSDYHWQDGLGPLDRRPSRQNRAWLGYTTNDVGVDEFILLCRKLRARPFICMNVGTGTPEEAAALVEYCNGSAQSKWGRLRAVYGHAEPYGVKD
jgi:alpha-N-arabinofuranosidase